MPAAARQTISADPATDKPLIPRSGPFYARRWDLLIHDAFIKTDGENIT
jgi:hypothetical protein